MKMMLKFYISFLTAAVVFRTEVAAEEASICMTDEGYSTTLTCQQPSFKIKVDNVVYGVNTPSCPGGACCVEDFILCTENKTTPQDVSNLCDGEASCLLASVLDVPAEDIQCEDSVLTTASFAIINYSCELDLPETVTTPSAIVTTKTTTQPASNTQPFTSSTANTQPKDNLATVTPKDDKNDIALVIGLSVAGGVLIIIIVVIIAVFTTLNRRHGSSDLSHNSTKTLATSDVENGDSPTTNQSSEDVYGFGKSAVNQQERLQKRNDNIKRNLSFKTEEKKNKRPPKLSKGKSKSKSSTLNRLSTNNSNTKAPKPDKESHKTKQSESTAKKKTTPSEKGNQAKTRESTHDKATPAADSKSNTNLLSI